jgi:hypothetical protein
MFIGTTTPVKKSSDTAHKTWTSEGHNVDRLDNISGIVYADQAGTLSVQQSADGGANWDLNKDISVTANTGVGFSEVLVGSNVRLKFTNTTDTDQTTLRISARGTSAGDS